MAHERIEVEEVGDSFPCFESGAFRAEGIVGQDGNTRAAQTVEMPFAEVAGGVTGIFESGRDGFFLKAQRVTMTGNARAIIGATGENGGAGGGANGRAGVEAIEAQTIGGHGIEVGCLENGMLVVTGLSPSLIVGHDENDVGFGSGDCEAAQEDEDGEELHRIESEGVNLTTGNAGKNFKSWPD